MAATAPVPAPEMAVAVPAAARDATRLKLLVCFFIYYTNLFLSPLNVLTRKRQ